MKDDRRGGRGPPGRGGGGRAPPRGAPGPPPGATGGAKPRGRRFEPQGLPKVWRSMQGVLTENAVPGVRVYGERLFSHAGKELRAWNPRRSKLAALLLAGAEGMTLRGDETVLYLGAASGTTVSHLSDMLSGGRILAVEKSARSMRDLLDVARIRGNVDPLLADAQDVDGIGPVLPAGADVVYQDIAQRDQAAIFVRACRRFLRPGGVGILMVKARSISIARDPRSIYTEVGRAVEAAGMKVALQRDLEPWEKDHAALVVTSGPSAGGKGRR